MTVDNETLTQMGPRPYPNWPGLRTSSAFDGGWSDGSNGQHRPPVNYIDGPWKIGWTDGRVGQAAVEHRALMDVQSAYDRSQLIQERVLAVEKLRGEVVLASTRYEQARHRAEEVEQDYADIRRAWTADPGAFSRFVGFVYLIAAVVLFAADLPLSFLAADGLGIRTAVKVNGEIFSVDNLWHVIRHWPAMWEPLILAVGITILGLFFKPIADYFMSTKHSSAKRTAAVVLAMVLVALTLSTFYYLGELRAEDKLIGQQIRSGQTPSMTKLDELAGVTFILLAIVLPMIGAYCFSAGMARLHMSARHRRLGDESSAARVRADELLETLTAKRAEFASAEYSLAAAKSEPLITDAWRALYEHGYQRGYATPESLLHGSSVYDRCVANVQRWIAMILQQQNAIRSKQRS